jgi:hypothetical protein
MESGRIWERPRCHSSFAYSCLSNYLFRNIYGLLGLFPIVLP